MKTNVGNTDRLFRLVLGVVIILWALYSRAGGGLSALSRCSPAPCVGARLIYRLAFPPARRPKSRREERINRNRAPIRSAIVGLGSH